MTSPKSDFSQKAKLVSLKIGVALLSIIAALISLYLGLAENSGPIMLALSILGSLILAAGIYQWVTFKASFDDIVKRLTKVVLFYAAMLGGHWFLKRQGISSTQATIDLILIGAAIWMNTILEKHEHELHTPQAPSEESDTGERMQVSVTALSAELQTLKQFICESKLLKKELDEWEGSKHRDHDFFADKGACGCSSFDDRTQILRNQYLFTHFERERIKDKSGEYEPDGLALYDRDKFKEWVEEKLVPKFQQIAALEPDRMNEAHVEWARRCNSQYDLYAYLKWLIPLLDVKTSHRHFEFLGLKKPESISVLKEIQQATGFDKLDKQNGQSTEDGE